jgi:TP901 family phage tail tape measure protein
MAERTVSVGIRMQMAGAITAIRNYKQAWFETRGELRKVIREHHEAADQISRAAMVAGAGLAVGVGYAVAKFAEFDAQMSSVNAVMRETEAGMGLLRDAALAAGESTVFSATEAAQAIEELGKAGISTAAILNGGLDGALSLAAAGAITVADAAEIAALAMQQFGLSGDEIPHVADLLAAAAGKSLGSVADLGMALQQSGLVLNQFGVSIEDGTGALAAFASAGLIGSDAGTSLKTMLMMLANPSKEASTLMEDLGINAYDAAGNFVGLTDLAGQLKSQMQGLTQAERDAALATIFGADAVRAANVLYTEGSQGITDWNLAVNDSGYAAEVAADRLDNLNGDLKTLKSTLDTALIQSGSGANDVLRSMTQAATGAVQAFSGFPKPVQQAAVWVGAAGAAITILGGAAIIAVPKVHALNVALTEMGTGRALMAKRALGGIAGILTGPWGAAIGSAIAIIGVFAAEMGKTQAETDELSATFDAQTGAVTENTRAWISNQLEAEGAFDTAKEFGISQSELVDSVLNGTDALAEQKAYYDELRAASGETGDEFRQMTDEEWNQADAVDYLDGQLGELQGTYDEAADRAENLRLGTEGGTAATESASAATQLYAQQLHVSTDAASAAKAGIQELDEALRQITETLFGVEEAEDAVASIVNAATAEFEENGFAIDGNSESALSNRETVRNLIGAYLDQVSAVAESTGSQEEAMAVAEDLEAEFRALARRLGLTEDQIDDYAAAFDQIPSLVQTTVKTSYVTTGQRPWIPKGGESPMGYADGGYVPGFANGGFPGFPTGGMFRGRGGPRDDANLIRVSNGEFIVNAAATARYRSLLEAVNSGRGVPLWGGIDRNTSTGTPMAGMAASHNSTVTVRIDFANSADPMARALQEIVRVRGAGNVQAAFGTR